MFLTACRQSHRHEFRLQDRKLPRPYETRRETIMEGRQPLPQSSTSVKRSIPLYHMQPGFKSSGATAVSGLPRHLSHKQLFNVVSALPLSQSLCLLAPQRILWSVSDHPPSALRTEVAIYQTV